MDRSSREVHEVKCAPSQSLGEIERDVADRTWAEERTALLLEAATVLLATDEPDAMLRSLFAKIGPHLNLDTYFNYMVNESRTALKLASCIGIPDDVARSIENLAFGQAICGTVAQHRQAIVATFIQQSDDPKAQLVKGFGIRAYACNPLMAGEQLLGTLSFASRSRDRFSEPELEFLQTICRYVSSAYERLRLIKQLQDADRRKDEFLATLAHELRNPLAPLSNGLHLLKLAGDDPELIEESRGMMERQIGQMVRLIDDLLDLSRISRGKVVLRKERAELMAIVRQAIETARPVIEQRDQELTLSLSGRVIFVDADVTRLSQVFANLLNNAAKYTDRGGRIRLSVDSDGNEAVVRVRDNGIGIPAEMLPRVFEMFTQVDQSLEKAQGGLGIGLSLVKGLVELHGGAVEASSAGRGAGSEFTVRIPALAATEPAPRATSNSDVGATSAKSRILVVDDNRDAAISLAMMLKVMGNDTQLAHDGVEAVEVATNFRPDVVVLDIGMPRMNGYDACRRIREQDWGSSALMIALTGWGQEEDKRRSEEAGFDAHLVKPANLAALRELICAKAPAAR